MSTNRDQVNRPCIWGSGNQKVYNAQESEVSLIALNDSNGNPIFLGRARAGTGVAESKWQIRKVTYDANQGVTRVEWPENDLSVNTTNFEFAWNAGSSATVTGVTNANPGVVTATGHPFTDGQKVYFEGIVGMTELNFADADNIYTVANADANTFELSGTDTTTFTAYSSGGTAYNSDFVNHSYG